MRGVGVSPLEAAVMRAVRCTRCGAAYGACDCWILLRCPKCRHEMRVARESTDYPEAVCVEVPCLKCDDGDFHELRQFDRSGKMIVRDPDSTDETPVPTHGS